MSALAHHIEAAGVPTVAIALVREHAERIAPPRALWVPFDFGRPLGPPGDREVQRAVLRAALAVLEAPRGPLLVDYEGPTGNDGVPDELWACPIALPPPEALSTSAALIGALLEEGRRLAPWHAEALALRGRTSVGLSGLGVDRIDEILSTLARFAAGEDIASPAGLTEAWPRALRFLADDAKAYYTEALSAQPGVRPPPRALARWLYTESTLGRVLFAVRARLAASADPDEQRAQAGLVPGVFFRLTDD